MPNKKINGLNLPNREPFFKELLSLLKEILFNALEALVCFLDDMHSFRNCLVVLTYTLVYTIIIIFKDVTAATIAFASWNIILAFYFKLRQDNQNGK